MEDKILSAKLAAAHEYFQKIGHEHNMNRIHELAQKLVAGEYGIAFAGHFSAGKSRMINNLLGENLLPSSPIPTSANLVRVHKGEQGADYARVYFHREKPRKYLAPYDYDLLRSFCKDGDQISEIELSRYELELPEKVVVMDTPGIDSADDAHRAATEAALHLADVILYVMDYNHVQAELNLSFTKDLTHAGKSVYLIVNQIDKHVESELSFESFCQGVENAFLAWGVKPAGFYYTSLKYPDNPHNQFPALKAMLDERIARRHELLSASVEASLNKIMQEYLQESQQLQEEHTAEARGILSALPTERVDQLRSDYMRLTTELDELQADWTNAFDAGMEKILSNAYLMPTSTRDLARDYLEACQPDFKVGLFTRGKKTMAEIERRKQVFFEDATEKAKSQLEWHIKTYFTDYARKQHIDDTELIEYVQNLNILPPEELLTDAMRSGAKLTQDGSYVMNYTSNFAEGTKNVARRYAYEFKTKLNTKAAERQKVRLSEVKDQLAGIEKYHAAWTAIDESRQEADRLTAAVDKIMAADIMPLGGEKIFVLKAIDEEIVPPMDGSAVSESVTPATQAEAVAVISEPESKTGAKASAPEKSEGKKADAAEAEGVDGKAALKYWAEKLQTSSQLIGHIPVLQQLAQELSGRAERLENKGFMVTLFGAFSAGKSSFANSLLGEALLPVSPNPTTAAINKICPVDGEHPHGTVIVKLKDEAMLLADVNRALSAFHMSAGSTKEAVGYVSKALADDSNGRQREKAFLRAFMAGYDAAVNHLGEKLTRELADFGAFAAQEEKSCFVDWLEVYYDCPFTKLGITLVDTPGADSINARHTNMSFNYIRQSDVVLFVTYYNHAFSRADREFLIQLGRVKDAFALDKMFFIVNAIDLAENEEEANGVVSYVADQLRRYGVKKPQMFGLSSQEILREKLGGKTEGFAFEDAFYKFVFEELTAIAVNAAKGEYELAREKVQELISLGRSDGAEKQRRLEELKGYQKQTDALLQNLSSLDMQNRQSQEANELVYYVKQRVFLRYTDFYRESFNPSVLQGRDNSASKLQDALTQLIESIGFDLAQELRATTLRMEQFIRKQANALQQQVNDKLMEINSELIVSTKDFAYESGIEYESAFGSVDKKIFNKALSIYKNPKSFFEQGGSKEMAAALEIILEKLAEEYLAEQKERLLTGLTEGTEGVFNSVKARFEKLLAENFAADLAALEGGVPVEELEEIADRLQKL